MAPGKLQYEVDADLAAGALVAAAEADPHTRRARLAAQRAAVQLLVLVLALYGLLLATDAGREFFALLGVCVVLGFVAGTWPTRGRLRRAVTAQTRKLAADPAHAVALGRRTVEFGRTTLTVRMPHARHEFDLGHVSAVRRTPDFLVLIFPGPAPFAVPREAFADDFVFDRFCEDATELVRSAGGTP